MAFPGDWQRKVEMTIPASQVTGDLSGDFFLVRLTHANLPVEVLDSDDANAPDPTGGDIRASADDLGASQIPVFVARFVQASGGTGAKAEMYVRLPAGPSSAVDVMFYLWWKSTETAPPAVVDPFGRNDCFADFIYYGGAQANPNMAAPQVTDLSGNGNDAALIGIVGGDHLEATDQGLYYSATSNGKYLSIAAPTGLTDQSFTVGGLVNYSDPDSNQGGSLASLRDGYFEGYIKGSGSEFAIELNGVVDPYISVNWDETLNVWNMNGYQRAGLAVSLFSNSQKTWTTDNGAANLPSAAYDVSGASHWFFGARHADDVGGILSTTWKVRWADTFIYDGVLAADWIKNFEDNWLNITSYVAPGTPEASAAQVTLTVTCKGSSDLAAIEGAVVYIKAGPGGDLLSGAAVAITRSGAVATVTLVGHGLTSGQQVEITGADQPEYNGMRTVTVVDADSFTYPVSGTPATPATGSPVVSRVVLYGLTDAGGQTSAQVGLFNPQPVTGYGRKGSAAPYFKQAVIGQTLQVADTSISLFMAGDE